MQRLVLLAAALPLLLWTAWTWGRRDAENQRPSSLLRVSGSSMAPTLLGRFAIADCHQCDLRWRIEQVPQSRKQPAPDPRI